MSAAERLLALAVRLLPAGERERYRREFAAEVADLPESERLAYALRVLIFAPRLRWSIHPASARVARRVVAVAGVLTLVSGVGVAYAVQRDRLIRAPLAVADARGEAPVIRWSYAVDPVVAGPYRTSAMAGDDVLVVSGSDLVGVDPAAGRELWRHAKPELNGPVPAGSSPDDSWLGGTPIAGTNLIGTEALGGQQSVEDGDVRGALVDARTGQIRLRARELGLPAGAHGTFAGGIVSVVPETFEECSPGEVTLRGLDGQVRWTSTVRGWPSPQETRVSGDLMFLGAAPTGIGDLQAAAVVDAATGRVIDETSCDGLLGFLPRPGGGWLRVHDPVVREGAGHPGPSRTQAFNAVGVELWSREVRIARVGDLLFGVEEDEQGNVVTVRRLDPDSGLPLWEHAMPAVRVIPAGDRVVLVNRYADESGVSIVDAATGVETGAGRPGYRVGEVFVHDGVVLVTEDPIGSGEVPRPFPVTAYALGTGEEAWRVTFTRGTELLPVGDRLVLVDRIAGLVHGLG
ncbi:hypothetical protein AADG42_00790 [Ammonicoccus fulvus]|uniref:Pyrroloquinoline-quinone binding quinoprotein n=1 Tax=Ammonicoccus fulvus TaxID=3138240 RepID=A0ABZ3FIQ6_9ACTN